MEEGALLQCCVCWLRHGTLQWCCIAFPSPPPLPGRSPLTQRPRPARLLAQPRMQPSTTPLLPRTPARVQPCLHAAASAAQLSTARCHNAPTPDRRRTRTGPVPPPGFTPPTHTRACTRMAAPSPPPSPAPHRPCSRGYQPTQGHHYVPFDANGIRHFIKLRAMPSLKPAGTLPPPALQAAARTSTPSCSRSGWAWCWRGRTRWPASSTEPTSCSRQAVQQ